MSETICRVRSLAGEGWCAVDFCPGCRVFHLKMGYATVHLNPEAFTALCGVVNAALARFQRQDREAKSAEISQVENLLH